MVQLFLDWRRECVKLSRRVLFLEVVAKKVPIKSCDFCVLWQASRSKYLEYNPKSCKFIDFLGIQSKQFAFTDTLLYAISTVINYAHKIRLAHKVRIEALYQRHAEIGNAPKISAHLHIYWIYDIIQKIEYYL